MSELKPGETSTWTVVAPDMVQRFTTSNGKNLASLIADGYKIVATVTVTCYGNPDQQTYVLEKVNVK